MAKKAKRIYVKAVEGRIARVGPRGKMIPDDRFIAVIETPYVKRLRDVHGDIVQQEEKEAE